MATAIQPNITDPGLAAAQNARLELTQIVLGTGKYTPNYGQTALVGYQERAAPCKARSPPLRCSAAHRCRWRSPHQSVPRLTSSAPSHIRGARRKSRRATRAPCCTSASKRWCGRSATWAKPWLDGAEASQV